MLRRLVLRDFIIVDELDYEFSRGLTVLTGETGAGKSILIDALQLVLGHRADSSVVREGCARADISAEFDCPLSLKPWLQAAGMEPTEGDADVLLLRRVIDSKGKSRAWINTAVATLGQLGELAAHLVDIHGQHAWQSLTRPDAVRAWLDTHAGVDTSALALAFHQYKAAQHALQQAQQRSQDQDQERERLHWQLQELDKLKPEASEWTLLNTEHARLAHAQQLREAAQTAWASLDDETPSVLQLLRRSEQALQAVLSHDAHLEPWLDELQSATMQLRELSRSLQHYAHNLELDPERLNSLDQRIGLWLSLARRYRTEPEQLHDLQLRWQKQLHELERQADIDALQREVSDALKKWQAQAETAQRLRQQAAAPLAQKVTDLMQDLGMRGGQLQIALQAQEGVHAYGLESVDLRVAGHAGATPRPLTKVASGGEMSRLALAVAVTGIQGAAQRDDGREAPTVLIFDEIDAGIGGAVAHTVGRMMRALGQGVQVLAVTHLAQVAAHAHQHVRISKQEHTGADGQLSTISQLLALVGDQRSEEIARLLSGDLSAESLAHARTVLQQAQEPTPLTTSAPKN